MTNSITFYDDNANKTIIGLEMLQNESTCESSEIIEINVAGKLFQTYRKTLEKYPNTLLGDPEKRQQFKNPKTKEIFFDRHRASFECILYYYQSGGVMARAPNIPVDIFVKELIFFELDSQMIDKMQTENGLKDVEVEKDLPSFKPFRILWEFLDYPQSSLPAKVFAIASVFIIVFSLVLFVIETLPDFKPKEITLANNSTLIVQSVHYTWMKYSNYAVIFWFTVEFFLRLTSCPSKLKFFFNSGNIIDFLSILPFYLDLALSSNNKSTSILRVIRVLRVFKLARHSRGLQILGNTLKASFNELMMLSFFLFVLTLIFGSCAYYAEKDTEGTKFDTIPNSFWWSIVTMTTVGYGDMAPVTLWGRLVGSAAVLSGVLIVALPVPVVVSNFEHFYKKERNRKKTEKANKKQEKEKNYLKVYKRFLLDMNFSDKVKKVNLRKYSMPRPPDDLENKLGISPNLNEHSFSRNNLSYVGEKENHINDLSKC